MKLDAEAVAKEMRRARGSNGERLFKVSEFVTAHQVASFFSRVAAKIKQHTTPGEALSEPHMYLPSKMKRTFLAQRSL